MTDNRLTQALARIEAASKRIETAAARKAQAAEFDSKALAARHEQLRKVVTESLKELDALIGSANQ